jgi:nitrate/nitrite transport system substrate-binding protein
MQSLNRAFSRRKIIKMLAISSMVVSADAMILTNAIAAPGELEKEDLKFGFIKLTDMAPIAIAYEKGFLKIKGSMSAWKHKQTGKCYWMA